MLRCGCLRSRRLAANLEALWLLDGPDLLQSLQGMLLGPFECCEQVELASTLRAQLFTDQAVGLVKGPSSRSECG